VELDSAHHKLIQFSQDHCPGQAVYWTAIANAGVVRFERDQSGTVHMPMMLDGRPVRVAVSQDNKFDLIGMNALHDALGIGSNAPGLREVKREDVGIPPELIPGSKIYSYPFTALSVGDVPIPNPIIYVYDEPAVATRCPGDARPSSDPHCAGARDLDLRPSELSKLHLYFSNQEKLLYVSAADAH
jgi:hypothetical protein